MRSPRRLRRLVVVAVAGLVAGGLVPTPAGARPLVPEKPEITLKTKSTNAGPHPVLRWQPVPDAARYVVIVQTPKGAPYWSWQGAGDRVRLGGGEPDAPKDSEGATLTRKMAWFVTALAADGTVIASSARRPIAP